MDGTMYMHSWADASYATHHDMRGHTGGVISLGKDPTLHGCSKQILNTKSSIESEVVGASNFLPTTIWAKYFFKAQGYQVSRNVFRQDITSTTKMLQTHT